MGNVDSEAAGKRITYEKISPISILNDNNGLLTYEYPLLTEINDVELANQLMNEDMKLLMDKKGYDVIDPQSEEGKMFLNELKSIIQEKIKTHDYLARVSIGSGILVERMDDSDPKRKLNLAIGIIKNRKNQQTSLLLHAVDLDPDGKPLASSQTKKNGSFNPPIWIIEKNYPFGYRGMFPSVCSYPINRVEITK